MEQRRRQVVRLPSREDGRWNVPSRRRMRLTDQMVRGVGVCLEADSAEQNWLSCSEAGGGACCCVRLVDCDGCCFSLSYVVS